MDNIKEFSAGNSGNGRKKNIVIIILCLLLVSFGVYHYFETQQSDQIIETVSNEKLELTYEYQDLLNEYEDLEASNDSINSQLTQERERIKQIMAELRSTKAQNKEQIKKYEKELKTLRDIMKSFIVQIDSLNQSNIALRAENKEIKEQFYTERKKSTELSQTLEAEKEKVAIASVIRAINMSFESYNHKGKPTDKAKKVLRLAIAFTLDENPIAPQGKKNIYVRFTNPENHILLNSEENTFSYEGEQIAYSAVREINYEGLAVDGIVYYENTGEPLISGTYKVDIFCDGHTIGTKSLDLK